VLVRFVVEEVALGQCSVRVLRISLVRVTPLMLRIIPLMLHTHTHTHTHLYPATYLTTRASGENLRAFKQSEFFSDIEQRWTKEKVFHIVLFYFSNVRTLCLVFRSQYVSGCLSVTLHWHITDCHKLRRIVDMAVDRFSSKASLLSPAVSVV